MLEDLSDSSHRLEGHRPLSFDDDPDARLMPSEPKLSFLQKRRMRRQKLRSRVAMVEDLGGSLLSSQERDIVFWDHSGKAFLMFILLVGKKAGNPQKIQAPNKSKKG